MIRERGANIGPGQTTLALENTFVDYKLDFCRLLRRFVEAPSRNL